MLKFKPETTSISPAVYVRWHDKIGD